MTMADNEKWCGISQCMSHSHIAVHGLTEHAGRSYYIEVTIIKKTLRSGSSSLKLKKNMCRVVANHISSEPRLIATRGQPTLDEKSFVPDTCT